MPVYEKTSGGRVYIRPLGEEFTVGDRVDVDDQDVAAHLTEVRGDFEVVETDDGAAHQEDEPPDVKAPFDPAEYTVDDLKEELQSVDDVDALDAIEAHERNEKGRDTAIEAVEERRNELED